MLSQRAVPPGNTRPAVYASASMADRRARILLETRRMLGEGGIEGLSIRELCKRANVALRTVYNAFHSKERLIAIAIRDSYDEVNRGIQFRTRADTLDGVIDRMMFTYSSSMKARNFTKSISSLYFAGGLSQDIWEALRAMVFGNLLPWLERVAAEGELAAGVTVDELAGAIANLEYSTSHDWAQGRVSDADFIRLLVADMLRMVAGSTRGETRERAGKVLAEIHARPGLPRYPMPGWREPRP